MTRQKLPKSHNVYQVFTDGSCWPNPGGNGGYAFIIKQVITGKVWKGSGAERNTTNNRMEMMAAIAGLQKLAEIHPFQSRCVVELITDSQYLGKGIAFWMATWVNGGFKNKNGDLWRILFGLVGQHEVYVTWVRGHTNSCLENEQCDKMAGEERMGLS